MKTENQAIKQPTGFKVRINENEFLFLESIVTGKQILKKAGKEPLECYTLYQKLKECDFERISLDDVVDLSNPGIEHFVTKDPEVFNYTVDEEPETTDKKTLTPTEILKLNAIDPNTSYLVQLNHDGTETDYAYRPDEPIKMICTGMKFVSRKWLDIIDIEEYGKTCKPVPPARKYKLRVDKGYLEFETPFVSGKIILTKANKVPVEKFDIFKVLSTNPQPQKIVDLNVVVDLREKCLVRFVTLPKEQQDGRGSRINFSLPEEDIEFLNNTGFHWEALVQGSHWLLINDYPIPEGYNAAVAQLGLLIPPNYPATQIDMVYFFPGLQKKSGRVIPAITTQQIDGKIFQRWSRHRKAGEWRPGLDNISTHLLLVNNWLEKELKR